MKLFTCLLLLTLTTLQTSAQFGEIRGKITDKATGQPMPGATVSWKVNDIIKGTVANEKGEYIIKPLIPGVYDIEFSFVTYHKQTFNSIQVHAEKATYVDAVLAQNNTLPPIDITWEPPMIDKGSVATMTTYTSAIIEQSVERDPVAFVTMTSGAYQKEEGGTVNIRGSRGESTVYVVDGIKMTGPFSIPKSAIAEISVITGGVPAQFGDATGGIVIITTKSYKMR